MRRIMGRKSLLAAVACAPFVLAGCGSSGDAPQAARTPVPTVNVVPDGLVASSAAVPIAEAKGLRSTGSLPRTAKGLVHTLEAVAPDGAMIMSVVTPARHASGDGVTYAKGRLEIVRPGAKTVRIPGTDRKVDDAVADRGHVVWAEAVGSGDSHMSPYRIVSYDRRTHAVHVLATLPASGELTAPAVSIAGGRAFWTVRGVGNGITQVFSRALSGQGRTVRHLRTPGVVDVSADGVVFGVSGTGAGGREFRILRLDPATGATRTVHTGSLAKGERLVGVSSAGGALAWTTMTDDDAKGTSVTRLKLRGADGKVVRFAPDLDAANARLTGRFLGFEGDSEQGKAWLYDPARGELVALGAAPARGAIEGAGGYVAWADGDVWRYAEVTPGQ